MGAKALGVGMSAGRSTFMPSAAGKPLTATGGGTGGDVPLDAALAKLQDRGGFMSQLLSRIRTQASTLTQPTTKVGGTVRTVSQVLGGRTGFMGGAGY